MSADDDDDDDGVGGYEIKERDGLVHVEERENWRWEKEPGRFVIYRRNGELWVREWRTSACRLLFFLTILCLSHFVPLSSSGWGLASSNTR